jgi:gliding motility-associated-like protein
MKSHRNKKFRRLFHLSAIYVIGQVLCYASVKIDEICSKYRPHVKSLLYIFSKTNRIILLAVLFSGELMAQCSGTQSLTANPTPLPGNTYNPGTVVTFCYTMVGYNEVGANWIDGFDLNIGAGWVPGSLTPVSPPANCGGGGGQWIWANTVTGAFSGATWGPGYFFDLNPDGNPGNDFGDQNGANCTWSFCFSLTAGNTPGASLSVTVEALSDGETGSWGSTACNGTPFTLSTATVSNNPGTVLVTANSSVCAGNSVTLTAVGATNYTWSPATGLNTTTGATVIATPATTTTYTVTGSGGCTTCTATTTVTVNPIPNVSVTPAAPSICSGQSTTLTASGATTYTWSPATGLNTTNGATVTANPTTTTTYTVTGTAAGCTDSATVTVTVNPIPTVTISPTPPTICAGQSIAITANGAVNYSWSPATGLSATTGATVTASPSATQSYTVTGTSGAGCNGSRFFTVTVNPLPVISVNPAIPSLCSGSTVVLAASGANTYIWSPGTGLSATTGTSVTANPTSTGFYNITGTDANGCVGTHAFTIIVTSAVIANISTTEPLCNGSSDGTAQANVTSGSAPYNFLWSNGQTTNPATGLPAGNISVTVTDNVGCSRTANATLTEPTAISSTITPYTFPGGANISCNSYTDGSADLTVSGGTGDYTFLWSNGQTTEDLSNAAAGNFTVTITDENNCVATNTVTLTEPASMTAALNSPTNSGGYNISCAGEDDGVINATVTNGTAPFTYLWSNGSTSQNISNGTAGNQTFMVTDANGCSTSASITLTEPAGMSSSVAAATYSGGYNVTCNGASDGSIDLTVTNASGNTTYLWSNGATTEDISNVPAGTYSVLATDVNGCTSSSSATLTQPALLAGNLTISTYNGNVNISCNSYTDGSINAAITGGAAPFSYNWSSGQTTQNISNLAAGNYSVTVTDANGCIENLSATLTEPNPLTASVFIGSLTMGGYNITCNGASDGAIDLTVADGTSPYSFSWSNGETDEDIYGLPAGNYSITVTDDNGCTVTENTALTEPPAVTATIASFSDVLCNGGNDGNATVNAGGGAAPYTYLWETGQTTASVTNFAAGIHNVTVTDIMGCTEMESITISEPPVLNVAVSGSNVICIGQSTQISATPVGGTAPYIYNWTALPADVSLTATDQNPTVSPVVPTTYTLTLTDDNGCSLVADVVNVPVNPPLSMVLSYNGPTGVCPGASTEINCIGSGGDGIYSWTINSVPGNYTSPYTAIPTATGYFVFTVDDNCGTPSYTDSILVTLYPLPVVDFSADTLSGCEPLAVRFTDNTQPAPAAYLWNFGDSHESTSSYPVNTYYQEGLYDVQLIATTSDGCVDSLTIADMIEVFPRPSADFTLSPTVENVLEAWINFTDQSSGAYSWHWDFGDDSTSTLINPQHFYTDTGRYRIWLTVTSQDGCTDSVQKEVRITPDFMIYIPNAFTPDENGLNDGFHVHGEGIKSEGFEFRIFTRWGEQIFATFDVNGTWYGDHNNNGKPVEPGVYVYTVLLKNIHNKVLSYKGHVVVLR